MTQNKPKTDKQDGTTKDDTRKHTVKLRKYFDPIAKDAVIEIKISKSLRTLLEKFTVKTIEQNTRYYTKALNEGQTSTDYIKRYGIKLSISNSVSYSNAAYLLFAKDLIEGKELRVPVNTSNDLTQFDQLSAVFNGIIEKAEQLTERKELTIEIQIKTVEDA